MLYHAAINDLFIAISYILSRSIYTVDNVVGMVTCYGLDSSGIECSGYGDLLWAGQFRD